MKKMICMILSLSMLFAACVAHADVLTEWGIPKEIAQRISVEQPIRGMVRSIKCGNS